jgi:hypothetical protein
MSGATSPEAETIIRQTETINRLMGQSASQIERVQRQLDGAYAAQQRYQQAQNAIVSATERGRITQERANELLQLAQQRYQQAGQAASSFASANDNAARGSRGFGQIIGQAGFQVQDFAVQVASGQSALTAFVQQGSQLAGVFGPAGAIAGAVLAIGGVAAQFLLMGESAAEAARKAQEAMNRVRDDTLALTRVVSDLAGIFLTAAENASRLANAQREALVNEGQQQMLRLTNEQTAAVQQYTAAQAELARVERDRARFRSMGPGFDSELQDVQGRQFAAQARLDAARSELDRTTQRLAELRGLVDRAGAVRTGPSELGPGADFELERQRELARQQREAEREASRNARRGSAASRRTDRSEEAFAERARRERDAFLASVDPAERYAQTLGFIADLNDRLVMAGESPLPNEAIIRASEQALEQYNRTVNGTAESTDAAREAAKRFEMATDAFGKSLAGAFEDLVFEGKAFDDVLKDLERSLLRLGNQYLLAPLFQQGLGALFGTPAGGSGGGSGGGLGGLIGQGVGALFGSGGGGGGAGQFGPPAPSGGGIGALIGQGVSALASLFHEGGIAGGAAPTRLVPASVFLDAPRYHAGAVAGGMTFANDEVPAILRRGEMVLTERQQQAVASRGNINQTIIVKAEDPGAFNRTRGQMARDMQRDLARASRST